MRRRLVLPVRLIIIWVVDEEEAERPDMRLTVAVAGPALLLLDTPGDTTPNAFVTSTKTARKSKEQSILQYMKLYVVYFAAAVARPG